MPPPALGRGSSVCMAGAAHLAVSGGRWCYEAEVLEARGEITVGLAGTSLGPQCTTVGGDMCSWGSYGDGGDADHGCVRAWRGREDGGEWMSGASDRYAMAGRARFGGAPALVAH
jgi:hypothetical protein